MEAPGGGEGAAEAGVENAENGGPEGADEPGLTPMPNPIPCCAEPDRDLPAAGRKLVRDAELPDSKRGEVTEPVTGEGPDELGVRAETAPEAVDGPALDPGRVAAAEEEEEGPAAESERADPAKMLERCPLALALL